MVNHPDGGMWTEADITINGIKLTFGQAMSLRVAITDFYSQMEEPDALGGDEHGLKMAQGYHDRLKEVLALISGGTK